MRDDIRSPNLGIPPREYDQRYFNNMVRNLEIFMGQVVQSGAVRMATVNISDLPTSDAGLRVGDLYNDTGTVKIKT